MELHKIRSPNYYHGHKVLKFFFSFDESEISFPYVLFYLFSFLDAPSVTL